MKERPISEITPPQGEAGGIKRTNEDETRVRHEDGHMTTHLFKIFQITSPTSLSEDQEMSCSLRSNFVESQNHSDWLETKRKLEETGDSVKKRFYPESQRKGEKEKPVSHRNCPRRGK
ncbi:hypothetical protein TNCV_810711 [Trichonephila clavipes]|uniref:Uncharacterized protein n=1 Tax=Trichonephila clavipes TaxID=2585209 RepID=A0A8X6SC12_TRICX|nr:hypothetical protein TNCV_810711 [Trichonephila clavipes]